MNLKISAEDLVGGWTAHLKNMLVKMGSSSAKIGVKIKKYVKPPPSHDLVAKDHANKIYSRIRLT